MTFYSPKVLKRFASPRYAGPLEGANASGRSASFECGSFVSFTLRVDAGLKTVVSAAFKTNGCGYMTAAADVLAEIVKDRKLGALHGLDREELNKRIDTELGNIPSERHQCVDVCIEALRAAFVDFRARQIEEFRGEKALICTCFGVSEETIDTHIRAGSIDSVDEVTRICNAGGGCGSCRMLIQEMIDGAFENV